MTDAREIERLRELRAKATPGPWYRADWQRDDGPNEWTIEAREPEVLSPGQSSIWPNGIRKVRIADLEEGDNPDHDAEFIVALVNWFDAQVGRHPKGGDAEGGSGA